MAANSALPLDDLPLDIAPEREPEFGLPRVSLASLEHRGRTGAEEAPNRNRALPRRGRSRRPLARFARADESPSFYLSLSDLMSLLLVFFVLIFSLTEMAPKVNASPKQTPIPKPTAAVSPPAPLKQAGLSPMAMGMPMPSLFTLRNRPEPRLDSPRLVKPVPQEPVHTKRGVVVDPALMALVTTSKTIEPKSQKRLSQLVLALEKEVRQKTHPAVEVSSQPDRVVLTLPESISFALGQAEIKPQAKATLAKLAKILAHRPGYRVVVTGHTDDLPIANQRFASNWDLSAARAVAVGRALVKGGLDESRLTVSGMADQSPRAVNDSPENRAKNRRVEIELRKES